MMASNDLKKSCLIRRSVSEKAYTSYVVSVWTVQVLSKEEGRLLNVR